ncbi:MAG: suppressor of fused domain protein [Desulfobacteraceae bacterium]|nr:suppressor of fused domain protein [Desulfobacteraceae bacterium]
MTNISKDNKIIAEVLVQAFEGKPTVRRFLDEKGKQYVDILTCSDRPEKGVSSYSTIGLSDTPLLKNGSEYPTRIEIIGVCGTAFSGFDNVLATTAFCIINSKWFCYPGAIFPNVLSMYDISSTMRHFIFVPPFLWEDKLKTITIGNKTIAWLLAVPISDEERQFAEEKGSDALENLFEEKQIDIYDLERASVV